MDQVTPEDESMFPEMDIRFAKLGARFGAGLIDGIILMIVTVPVTYYNVTHYKMPLFFILTSLFTVIYKPFMEYRFGATLGKMAVGIQVVGNEFQKVTLREEVRRVSFYLVPNIISEIMMLKFYFSADLKLVETYKEYTTYITSSNPALLWLNGIVFVLLIADAITFLSNEQNRSLHDIYAGTYVIERGRNV